MIRTLDDICVDKELGIELKKRGFPQDTLFYRNVNTDKVRFIHRGDPGIVSLTFEGAIKKTFDQKVKEGIYVATPIAEEMLKKCPYSIGGWRIKIDWMEVGLDKLIKMRTVQYGIQGCQGAVEPKADKKLCNALAMMYIQLVDDGEIVDEDIENLKKLSETIEKCGGGK